MENKGCPIADDWLDCLANTVPSPNDLVLDLYEDMVFLNVTRANANWGGPLYRIQSCADLAVTNVTYDGSKKHFIPPHPIPAPLSHVSNKDPDG